MTFAARNGAAKSAKNTIVKRIYPKENRNEREIFFCSFHFRHIYMKSSCKVFALQNFIILLVNSMPSVWKSSETISLFVSLTLFLLWCLGDIRVFFSVHGKCATLSLSSSSSHSYRKMAHERKYIFLPVNMFSRRVCVYALVSQNHHNLCCFQRMFI